MEAVTFNGISKSYGEQPAVRDISLNIPAGKIFGVLGPDGAGKTTLFRMVTTLLVPDKGDIKVLGQDAVKDYKFIRTILGYMPGRFSLYQDLTVEENLNFFASIFQVQVKDNYYLIEDIYKQIAPFKNRKAGQLSGGMKQKLALSCALIHKPELLVLDEPTTGVDAVSRTEFWDMLHKLKQFNISILVSTPYMDEAMRCDEVALMFKGEILQAQKPDELVKGFPKQVYAVKSNNMYQCLLKLRDDTDVESAFLFGQEIHITLKKDKQAEALEQEYDCQVEAIEANIEDVFIHLSTKHA